MSIVLMTSGAYDGIRALRSDLDRFVSMVSEADLAVRVPGLTWTVGDTVAHVTGAVTALGHGVAGDDTGPSPLVEKANQPEGPYVTQSDSVRPVNELVVKHYAADSAEKAAAGLLEAGEVLLGAIPRSGPDAERQTPWYGKGQTRTARTIAAAGHGEILMHGFDVARALGKPWPLSPDSAGPVVANVLRGMTPYLLTPAGRSFRGVVELRIRGFDRFTLDFGGDGTLVVGGPRRWRDITYRLTMTPEAALLVGYGRASMWGYVVRGAIRPGGPQAWRAVRFGELLANP